MNKEDLILEKLERIEAELAEAKRRAAPLEELKQDLEPIIRYVMQEAIDRLDQMGTRVRAEDLEDLATNLLASSGNLAEMVKLLNGMMELKQEAGPILKTMMSDAIQALDNVTYRFEMKDVGNFVQQLLLNFNNLTEALKILGSLMELKESAESVPRLALTAAADRLEEFRLRGGFEGLKNLAALTENLAVAMADFDPQKAQPIEGVFGLLKALRRREVQQGLGMALEMAAVLGKTKPS